MQKGRIKVGETDYEVQCSLATARLYKRIFNEDINKNDISLAKLSRKVTMIDPTAKTEEEVMQIILDNPELLDLSMEMQERAIRLFFVMCKEAEAGSDKTQQARLLGLNELDFTLFLMDFDADVMDIVTTEKINNFWNSSMVASSQAKNQNPQPSDL